ncbi:MAG: aspartate dehydrogenase [Clostridiales bacterium]|nr:aspartate dehydrogenase [Clostridiales bacterium]
MGLFSKKKKEIQRKEYDASLYKPVLRCSICTGEQVTGFKNLQTGQIEEIGLIRNAEDLQAFLDTYGLDDVEKIY